ncbi:Neurotensin receptor type 1, partial [Antrostomus carolinensis]
VNTFISFVFPMVVISVLNTIIANQLMVMFKQAAQENQVCTIVVRIQNVYNIIFLLFLSIYVLGFFFWLCLTLVMYKIIREIRIKERVSPAAWEPARAVVIAFVVCWLPYHIRRLMFCYVPSSHWTDFLFNFYHYFYMLTNVLFYVSSAINPILYNLVSANFRQIFLSTLTLLC